MSILGLAKLASSRLLGAPPSTPAPIRLASQETLLGFTSVAIRVFSKLAKGDHVVRPSPRKASSPLYLLGIRSPTMPSGAWAGRNTPSGRPAA